MFKKILLGLLVVLIISGCSKITEAKRSQFYLERIFEAKIQYKRDKEATKNANKALNRAFNKLIELDTNLNKLSAISEISAINSMSGLRSVEISSETYNLIKKSITGSVLTDGYFDITWEPLTKLFENNKYPQFKQIENAKLAMGYLNVQLDKNFNKVKFGNLETKINLDRVKRGFAIWS